MSGRLRETWLARTAALAAAGIVGAAGSARAGDICQVYRAGVPDFDQVRSTLPNDGKMYCVPASWVNWMAFLQNNGYHTPMYLIVGTQNWQSQSLYGVVSNRIAEMGVRMDTDAFGGTSLDMSDVLDYVQDYTSPDPYMIGIKKTANLATPMLGPSPKYAASQLFLGGLVNLHISWFKREGDHYKRKGGHSVSMIGATNLCGTTPHLRYRDPGSGDSKTQQSTFSMSDTSTHLASDIFQWTDSTTNYLGFLYQMDGYDGTTKGFLTGVATLMVNFGVGINTTTGQLNFFRPLSFTREVIPTVMPYTLDGAGRVLDLQFTSDMTQAVVLTGGEKPASWLLDLATGEHKPFFPFDKVGPLAIGRFGEIFSCDGSVLKIIDGNGKTTRSVNVDRVLSHLAYDDGADELVGIDPTGKRLLQFDRSLNRIADRPLPGGLSPDEKSSIAIHPITRVLWMAMGDGSVFEITRPRSGNPARIPHTLPGVTSCASLQFLPDGALTVLCDGSVREFRSDEAGKLIESDLSGFGRQHFDGVFRLAQSKDDTPAELVNVRDPDIDPPAEAPEEIADCTADYDGSGFVDTDDFTAFVLDFEAGLERSDVDYSGFVDTDDFTEFVKAFEQGC